MRYGNTITPHKQFSRATCQLPLETKIELEAVKGREDY